MSRLLQLEQTAVFFFNHNQVYVQHRYLTKFHHYLSHFIRFYCALRAATTYNIPQICYTT